MLAVSSSLETVEPLLSQVSSFSKLEIIVTLKSHMDLGFCDLSSGAESPH